MTDLKLERQFIRDLPLSRRNILRGAVSSIGAASTLGMAHAAFASNPLIELENFSSELFSNDFSVGANDPLWGMAMSYGEERLDLIDLDNSKILHSITDFEASHAITPIEHLNRFVVHGYRPKRRVGALLVIEVNPKTKAWEILLDKDLIGGRPLHWQPRPDLSEIVFNTIGDCLLYTSPSPRDATLSRMPSSA